MMHPLRTARHERECALERNLDTELQETTHSISMHAFVRISEASAGLAFILAWECNNLTRIQLKHLSRRYDLRVQAKTIQSSARGPRPPAHFKMRLLRPVAEASGEALIVIRMWTLAAEHDGDRLARTWRAGLSSNAQTT